MYILVFVYVSLYLPIFLVGKDPSFKHPCKFVLSISQSTHKTYSLNRYGSEKLNHILLTPSNTAKAWRHCKAASNECITAGHCRLLKHAHSLPFQTALSSPTWIRTATGRAAPPCINRSKEKTFPVWQASKKGDCLWALAHTKQPAWRLLERIRVKLM